MTRGSIRIALALGLALGVAATAEAHTGGSPGYASITVTRGTVRYSLTLPTSALPSDLADAVRLAQGGSARSREQLLDVLRTRIVLHASGTRCEPGPGYLQPAPFDSPTVTMSVDFACGSSVNQLSVQDNIFDALGPDHHTLAKVETPSGIQQFAFAPDSRQAQFAVDHEGGGARGTGSFFLLGVEHIVTGYDHLLFLLALLLPGGGLLSLAKIITAFTIAHSITLTLAVLQVVTLPDRLIEAVIALSIAFVAAENLFFEPMISRRWLVSFGFGLVHGFGFSSALRELGLPRQGLLLSLFGFNAGVEAGQALVIVACLPLLLLLRRTRWASPAISTCSIAVLAVGLVLFVERAFL
jgi:hydrogenase/urease accessory protein HupE